MKRFTLSVLASLLAAALALNVHTVPTLAQTLGSSQPPVSSVLGGSTTTALGAQTLIDVTSNASGTVQNTFYTLNSVTIPASGFNAATRGLHCDTWGVTAGNANNKDFRWNLAAGQFMTMITAVTLNAKNYHASIGIVRSGVSTQSAGSYIIFDSPINTTFSGMNQLTTWAGTETSSMVLAFQSQNTAAAAASATGNGMLCTFMN